MDTNKHQKLRKPFLKTLLVIGFVFVFFSVFVPSAQAAELYFGVSAQEVGVRQQFEVGIFLNTNGQEVNAFEGSIEFPRESLELTEIRDGSSIVSFWIEKPRKDNLFFSGIVPGGYNGERGYLFSLIFTATKIGEVTISTQNERVLLHDGEGSMAEVTKAPLRIRIQEEVFLPGYLPPEDVEIPEVFTPSIAQDPNVFDGKWFLVFYAQDKIGGVERYEIRELRELFRIGKFAFGGSKWAETKSPHLLKDQELRSRVFIKAIDRAGNERIVSLPAQHPFLWYENYLLWIIILLGAFGVFVRLRISWKQK